MDNWREQERQKYIDKFGYNPDSNWEKGECTCTYCEDYKTCNLAFDEYSIDGDCLKWK